jgi:hypothetical protein
MELHGFGWRIYRFPPEISPSRRAISFSRSPTCTLCGRSASAGDAGVSALCSCRAVEGSSAKASSIAIGSSSRVGGSTAGAVRRTSSEGRAVSVSTWALRSNTGSWRSDGEAAACGVPKGSSSKDGGSIGGAGGMADRAEAMRGGGSAGISTAGASGSGAADDGALRCGPRGGSAGRLRTSRRGGSAGGSCRERPPLRKDRGPRTGRAAGSAAGMVSAGSAGAGSSWRTGGASISAGGVSMAGGSGRRCSIAAAAARWASFGA